MENIKVFLRIRPYNGKERNTHSTIYIRASSKQELVVHSNVVSNANELKFEFDHIFDENAKQCEVYNAISAPIIQDVIRGYNCTLYAYGASGASQNYTMIGKNTIASPVTTLPTVSQSTLQMNDASDAGIIPRTLNNLFDRLKALATSYTVRVSYLEIFNDELIDLLQCYDTSTTGSTLKIFENVKNQVIINGLTEVSVQTSIEALSALQTGQSRLKNHLHSVNSYTIFSLNVQLKEKPKNCVLENDLLKFSKLNFVQLISAENSISKGRAKSLASFNRVVQALIDKQSHVPYRDTKFTRILQESLGGNAKTSFIATISPDLNSIEETLHTLELMGRIKCVFNQPRINKRLNRNIMLNDIASEITQLRRDIEATTTQDGISMSYEVYDEHRNLLDVTRSDILRNRFELQVLNDELENLNSNYAESESNLCVLSKKLSLLHRMKDLQNKQLNAVAMFSQQKDECITQHVATEENLTEQSIRLIKTVDEQTNDASLLCDSIARRKALDNNLKNTFNNFQSDLDTQLKNLSKYMVNSYKVFQSMIFVHKANIERFHNMTTSMLESFKSNLISLEHKTSTTRQKGQENIDLLFGNIFDDFNKRAIVDTNFTASTISPFEQFVSMCEKQFELFGKARKTFLRMIENRTSITSQMTSNLKDSIETFSKDLLTKFNRYRLNLEESSLEQDEVLRKFIEAQEHYQLEIKKMTENSDRLKLMDLFAEDTEGMVQKSMGNCMQLIMALKSHANTTNEKKANSEQQSLANDCTSTMTAVINLLRERIVHENLTEQAVINSDNIALKAADHQFDDIKKNISERCAPFATNEFATKIINDFKAENLHLMNSHDANCNLVQNMVLAHKQFSKKIRNEIESVTSDFKYFCEIDFCQYPNGETPVKKEYKTNVTLAATTPNDELKRKFREKFNQYNGDESNNK